MKNLVNKYGTNSNKLFESKYFIDDQVYVSRLSSDSLLSLIAKIGGLAFLIFGLIGWVIEPINSNKLMNKLVRQVYLGEDNN
jgi:uncharacterized membrane protein